MSDFNDLASNSTDLTPGQLFDRSMEEALLGAVMISPNVFFDVASILNPEDFYLKSHQWIWEAFRSLFNLDPVFDVLTVKQELDAHGHLEEIGGMEFLIGLSNQVPSSLHAESYARNISALATRRRLLQSANDIARLAYRKDYNVDTVIDQAEQAVFGVSQDRYKHDLEPIKVSINQYLDRLSELSGETEDTTVLKTGLARLDQVLGGLHKSDFLLVAGRPGSGKTGFLAGIMKYVGLQLKRKVAVFSLEMSSEQLLQRLLAMETEVDSQKLRSGKMSDQEMLQVVNGLTVLSDAQIYIDDTPAITPLQIRTKCRRLQMEEGLDLVLIDYLQLMSAEVRTENRVQEVSYISRYLKVLARELRVPVLAAAQLNRAVESRPDKQLMLSDLRESGSLEQDADIVMFISRPDQMNQDSPTHNIAKISVAKHRNGPVQSDIQFVFIEKLAMFRDMYVENR